MKRRRKEIARRARTEDRLEDGQDSFLDVVSNLVGVLIILIMVAGARVRNASAELSGLSEARAESESTLSAEEEREREEYVAAVTELENLEEKLNTNRAEAQTTSEQLLALERQTENVDAEHRRLVSLMSELDALFQSESLKKSAEEKESFDLKSSLVDKEQKLDRLRKEKEALVAARPKATVLENIPTPLSKRVADGREGFFCLKKGRLSHVPIVEFQERVMLNFKNYRGELTPREFEEKIGPVENYVFKYYVELGTHRNGDGLSYHFDLKYGECIPTSDTIGEPVDDALANPDSVFRNRLLKYVRDDTTITVFVYPDSFGYLNDVKKYLFTLGYMTAFRPLPEGAPISLSPNGTASSTY